MNSKEASRKIKEMAKNLGFELTGITKAETPTHLVFFENWLKAGFHGQMDYLSRGLERRKNPELILPNAKSIICCGLIYFSEPKKEISSSEYGKISSYAWGKDYHDIVHDKLKALEKFIKAEISPAAQTKFYADTGAVLERDYAQKAGLGWMGKNTCLIHPQLGSWFFLGEILTDMELEYDSPFIYDHCGTCTRCIDACPTQAIKAPRLLDARDCISYLTIEHRGPIPEEKRGWIGSHISGCDICQEVCPYNQNPLPTGIPEFYPQSFLNEDGPGNISLEKIASFTAEEFKKNFFESPIKRLKYEGLIRNAVLAMANSGENRYLEVLSEMKKRFLQPDLQEYIDWALKKLSAQKITPLP